MSQGLITNLFYIIPAIIVTCFIIYKTISSSQKIKKSCTYTVGMQQEFKESTEDVRLTNLKTRIWTEICEILCHDVDIELSDLMIVISYPDFIKFLNETDESEDRITRYLFGVGIKYSSEMDEDDFLIEIIPHYPKAEYIPLVDEETKNLLKGTCEGCGAPITGPVCEYCGRHH